jgi:septum site-determining protein MinD
VLPASQTRDKDALTEEGVEKVLKELEHMGFDYVVCDSPAGIEHGAVMALTFADEALSSPTRKSPRCATPTASSASCRPSRAAPSLGGEPVKEHLLITRYSPKRVEDGEMLSYKDVQEILRVPIIGVIPESESCCRRPTRARRHPPEGSDVAEAYLDVVGRFLGEESRCASSITKSPACSSDCSEASEHVPALSHLRQQAEDRPVAKERLQLIIAHERGGRPARRTSCPTCKRN